MWPRVTLLLLLIHSANGVWLVENPGSSLIALHDRFQWLIRVMRKSGLSVPLLHGMLFVLLSKGWRLEVIRQRQRPLMKVKTKVFRTAFFMSDYEHSSAKPTKIWSNCWEVCLLSLCRKKYYKTRKKRSAKAKALARKYVNKEGKVCYTGTSSLKASQLLDEYWCVLL